MGFSLDNDQSDSLTIVSVTGAQSYARGSALAIERSFLELQSKIKNLYCILVCPEKLENLPDYIQHIPCKPFGYMEYNIFMLYSLDDIIQTDYCLVVQNDGWILNGDNWDNRFLQFDYLGAPTPYFYGKDKGNKFVSCEREKGINYLIQPNASYINVQNGGFSLRSKKLLGMPRALGLSLEILPPKRNLALPLSFQFEMLKHNEDAFLTVFNRNELEKNGICYANDLQAAYFSSEYLWINDLLSIDISRVLGAHWLGFVEIVGINEVLVKANKTYWYDITKRNSYPYRVIKLFVDLGYNVHLLED